MAFSADKGFGKKFIGFFDWFGKFFRSHAAANDREERPFNRAERHGVYHLADAKSNLASFGSTLDMGTTNTPLFVNGKYPPLEEDILPVRAVTVGPYSRRPYEVSSIFNISAMSYGALSPVAVRALSHGAKLAGCWMNTGEGGLAPAHLEGGCDIVFQYGTAKYGVRDEHGNLSDEKLREIAAHPEVRMIEIKLAQGAKPGKGGILPAAKVTPEIAAIRGIPVGKDSISPNRHRNIANDEQLLDEIAHVREVTGLPVGIKIVLSNPQDAHELCEAIMRRGVEHAPDFITLDGGEGGTGASPMVLMDNMGIELKESLPMLMQVLNDHGLKDRIPVVASGKLINGAAAAWALCAGATFVNSARGFMFSMGCVQSQRCEFNTCPTGITTLDPKLQKLLNPMEKYVKVANYKLGVEKEIAMLAHSCGLTDPRDLRPYHVRIVTNDGPSLPLSEQHPGLMKKVPSVQPASAPAL